MNQLFDSFRSNRNFICMEKTSKQLLAKIKN